jgi:uncharacterized protein
MSNVKIVEKWNDVLNRQAIDEIGDVFHDDGVVIYGSSALPNAKGPKEIGALLKSFFAGFPDLNSNIVEVFDADGDRVVGRFLTKATHTAEFMGVPPTGKQVSIHGAAIFRIKDGKVIEEFNMDDLFGLAQQIGAVPSAG